MLDVEKTELIVNEWFSGYKWEQGGVTLTTAAIQGVKVSISETHPHVLC